MSELTKGWVLTKLGDLLKPSSEKVNPQQMPEALYIGLEHIEKDSAKLLGHGYATEVVSTKSRFYKGDLLYGKLRPYLNKLIIPSFDGVCSTDILVFSKQDFTLNEFLLYCFLSSNLVRYASEKSVGVQHPRIDWKTLSDFSIPLPPLNEQRRIVAKLEKLLAKCEASKQRLDKIPGILKRFRQSILAAACSGRLTADWREQNPDTETASELLARIQKEKQQKYEKEYSKAISKELRKPKQPTFSDIEDYGIDTWKLAILETIAEAIVDCPHSTPKWTDSGFVCARTTQFEPFNLKLDDVKYVGEKTFKERTSRLKPQAGDVLYSREGGILGIACQIPIGLELCLGQRMMLVRCNSDWLSGEYLTMLLNSEVILSQVKELITGTASPHLNVGDVKAFRIPIPPLAEQKEIIQRVEKLFKLADQIEQRYQKARAYVDKLPQSILAKAFRGELVPQDPNDEPASVVLERIRAKREQQTPKKAKNKVSEGKKRGRKPNPNETNTAQLDLSAPDSVND